MAAMILHREVLNIMRAQYVRYGTLGITGVILIVASVFNISLAKSQACGSNPSCPNNGSWTVQDYGCNAEVCSCSGGTQHIHAITSLAFVMVVIRQEVLITPIATNTTAPARTAEVEVVVAAVEAWTEMAVGLTGIARLVTNVPREVVRNTVVVTVAVGFSLRESIQITQF